jgi:hypothetical protein
MYVHHIPIKQCWSHDTNIICVASVLHIIQFKHVLGNLAHFDSHFKMKQIFTNFLLFGQNFKWFSSINVISFLGCLLLILHSNFEKQILMPLVKVNLTIASLL